LFLHDVGTEIIGTLCPMTGAIPKQWHTIFQHTTFVLEHCYLLSTGCSFILPRYCTCILYKWQYWRRNL